jgi:hypothetical protein
MHIAISEFEVVGWVRQDAELERQLCLRRVPPVFQQRVFPFVMARSVAFSRY